MKVVILAGGYGTRLAEITEIKPKPMVEIGGKPILWHIMKHYGHYGHKEFLVALGYKGDAIKHFFLDYRRLRGSMTLDLAAGKMEPHSDCAEDWTIHLVETGIDSLTGGRVKRLESWLRTETFMLTYGDGVSDIDLGALLQFHRRTGCMVTVSAVRPPARFGGIVFDGDLVAEFTEKPQIGEGWINGGFLVCEPDVLDYLKDDQTSFESDVLEKLAAERQLAAYRHDGFWQCMDTLRDKRLLDRLWEEKQAPWRVWT